MVAVSANLLNIALNATLIYGAGLGIAGAALGTTLAQSAAAVVLGGAVLRTARAAGVAPVAGAKAVWTGLGAGAAGGARRALRRLIAPPAVRTNAQRVTRTVGRDADVAAGV